MNRSTTIVLIIAVILGIAAGALLLIGDEESSPPVDGVDAAASEVAPGTVAVAPDGAAEDDAQADAHAAPEDATRIIHGRIIDEADQPVAGASVTLTSYGRDPVSVAAGSDGAFEATVGESLPLHVAAEAEGFVRGVAVIRAYGRDVEIVLRRGRQVSGVVISPDGEALPGATVVAGRAQTLSRAGGVFVLEGLPPAPVAVEARRGMSRSEPARVDLTDGPAHGLKLRLQPAGSLEVRVRDTGGAIVPNARVEVTPLGWNTSYDATTGDDGNAVFEPLPAGTARVTASATDRADAEANASVSPNARETIILQLSEAHAIVVHTRLDRGAPERGEAVTLRLIPAEGELVSGVHLHQLSAGIGEPAVFESVAAGEWRVVAHHPTYSADPVPVSVPGPDATVVLEQGGSVSGRVLDDQSAPVAGAFVLATPLLAPTADRKELRPARRGRTDAEGHFEIDGLTHGDWRLVARMPGYVEGAPITARPGDRNVELRLDLAREITGQVVDGRGAPAESIRVVARALDGDRHRAARGVTEADGSFRIPGLHPGRYTLYAERAQRRSDPATTTAGGTPVQLVLPIGATVRGRVVGPGGRPLETFTVLGFTYGDPSGAFELLDLDPRETSIWIEAPGLLRKEVPVALQDDRVTQVGTIELPAPARLAGRVETEDGLAVAGATVVLEVQENGAAHPAIVASDEGGHFEFTGLRLGRARVQAMSSEGSSDPSETILRSGETATLRLIVPAP